MTDPKAQLHTGADILRALLDYPHDPHQQERALAWLDEITALGSEDLPGSEPSDPALARAETGALYLVARIREALGDNGLRMQDELLSYCRELAALPPRVAELEGLLRRARAVIPAFFADEIEVRAAINRYLNTQAQA